MNKKFSHKLQNWLDSNGYNHNTKVKTLKVVLTVCNHARENGIPTHPELPQITKNLRYKESDHIYLNFEEIKIIGNTKMPTKELKTAKSWLIISCYTAQRVSDFFRFSREQS